MSCSTLNRSIWRRSSQPNSWLVLKKLNLAQQKANIHREYKNTTIQNTKAKCGRVAWPPAWKLSRSKSPAPHTAVSAEMCFYNQFHWLTSTKFIKSFLECLWSICRYNFFRETILHIGRINNNNTHFNLYGAVITTKAIARVHLVHFINADWQPRWLPTLRPSHRRYKWQLPSTSTIAICYYYSAQKLTFMLPSHAGWKAEST